MASRTFAIAVCLFALWSATPALAADPEYTVGRVLESRHYERKKNNVIIGGVRATTATEWTSRVTVVIEGERITGEWVPESSRSASAKDFPRGSDVDVAINRNRMLLKAPGGSTVTARIVRRVTPEQREKD